jgi:hypothetical protein
MCLPGGIIVAAEKVSGFDRYRKEETEVKLLRKLFITPTDMSSWQRLPEGKLRDDVQNSNMLTTLTTRILNYSNIMSEQKP